MSSCKDPEILSIEMFKRICPPNSIGECNLEQYLELKLNGKQQPVRLSFKGSGISGRLSIITGMDLSAEKWFLNQNPKGLLMYPEYIEGGSVIARNLPNDYLQAREDYIGICLKAPHKGRIFLEDITETRIPLRLYVSKLEMLTALMELSGELKRVGLLPEPLRV